MVYCHCLCYCTIRRWVNWVPRDTIGSLEEPLLLSSLLFSLDGGVVTGGTVEELLFPPFPPLFVMFPFSSTIISGLLESMVNAENSTGWNKEASKFNYLV